MNEHVWTNQEIVEQGGDWHLASIGSGASGEAYMARDPKELNNRAEFMIVASGLDRRYDWQHIENCASQICERLQARFPTPGGWYYDRPSNCIKQALKGFPITERPGVGMVRHSCLEEP